MSNRLIGAKYRASDTAILRTAAEPWRDKDVKAHMDVEKAKHAGTWPINRMREGQLCFGIAILSVLAGLGTMALFNYAHGHVFGEPANPYVNIFLFLVAFALTAYTSDKGVARLTPWQWERFAVTPDGAYLDRDGIRYLPGFARELIGQIRNLIPDAQFEISVLGTDPVLWCLLPSGERATVLVWDEHNQIVLPPRPYEE